MQKKTLDSNFSSDVVEMKNLVFELNNSWLAKGKPKIHISNEEKVYKNYRRSICFKKISKRIKNFPLRILKL